jgi:hypothetical protein
VRQRRLRCPPGARHQFCIPHSLPKPQPFRHRSIFTTPAAGTFTTQRNRNILFGPGSAKYNASLQKRFQTFEDQFLTFRFDAFNFPNHPNWSTPDSTYTDATFGKVTSKTGQRAMQASIRYSF